MKLHYEGVELCLRQTGAAATGQGPLTLEFGGLRVTVESSSDGVSTIAGGRVERRRFSKAAAAAQSSTAAPRHRKQYRIARAPVDGSSQAAALT